MTAVLTNHETTGLAMTPEVTALRAAGTQRFAQVGFPTTKDEDWRFTPVTAIATGTWGAMAPDTVSADALRPFVFGHGEWPAIVFVNGRYAPELSHTDGLPEGVTVGRLAECLEAAGPHLGRHAETDATPFVALNASAFEDGAFIRVAKGVELTTPVLVVHVTTAAAAGGIAQPRSVFVVERAARVAIIEKFVTLDNAATYVSNPVTEIQLAEDAWLEHVRIQRESEAAHHVGYTGVDQAGTSHYRSFAMSMGARLARHDLSVRHHAAHTETLMYGLYLGRGEQLVDNHTAIRHQHPACNSWEVYKGILSDRAKGVFNGKIYVTPEAQQTDAKQTNRALLLSPDARVDTKPQLEIFADDVKCTHGATVGYLDPMPLFYFRSRGIPEAEAHRQLTYAFAAEVVAEVQVQAVREELDRLVRGRLGA